MYKVLFVCTANIFRSRFSEEVFNFLAKKNNIRATAFSAGLKCHDIFKNNLSSCPGIFKYLWYRATKKR